MQNNVMKNDFYDLIIIGAGPAGLTCGIYAARAGLRVGVVEKLYAGGQIASADEMENFPGFLKINGSDFAFKMLEQAEAQGAEMIYAEVLDTRLVGAEKTITLSGGKVLKAKTVAVCSGANAKKIGAPNEQKFTGRGVSYCAVCDGAFYKGKVVAVVGGGNTAIGDALYLSKFAEKVFIIHRRKEFRADKALIDKLDGQNVEFLRDTVVLDVVGGNKVEGLLLENLITLENYKLSLDGVFIAIGQKPESENFTKEVTRDEYGYVITNEDMETNIDGVYCAGDVRAKKVRQVITACADGAIAAETANLYITFRGKS